MGNWKMKNILIFLLLSLGTNAQKIRPLFGVSYYIDSSFEKSAFRDIKLGVEYELAYFSRPEIEVNYMFGDLETYTNRDNTGLLISEYSKNVSAINYSFCPKIILGNKSRDNFGYLHILPKYTYSNIEANSSIVYIDPSNLNKYVEKKERTSNNRHSFGIGLGCVLDFSEDNTQSCAFNIYFNNLDLGSVLNMPGENYRYSTKDVIGFGVNYYYSFKKKKTN